ncbi:FAD-dependent oxidoreductase [Pararhizobium sp. O133]|uniref:FAD-dependent oxidoreductase n=1 Tax=Pararhizobium sp. O133 TaxID=3449278 RepID=UPI003F68643E
MIVEGLDGLAESTHDVCVIGAGPVGITLALELASKGKRVLVLESGGRTPSPVTQELSRAEIADPVVHDDMRITVSRQLGGTSNLWGARCQPLDPVDFEPRGALFDASWPIRHADILPYYEKACAYANCGEPVFRSHFERLSKADDRFDTERMERFSRRPAFQKAHAEALESNPLISIRLNATVSDLVLDDQGIVKSIIVSDASGSRIDLTVKTVVLAMGGLETTRLLLALQRKSPGLFGGQDGVLGRYYMAHVIGEVADVTWTDAEIDAAYDFQTDGHGSYARRRLIPSDREILEKNLPNVSFWPVVPPVADARHRSSILSMVFLVFAFKPIGSRLVAEVIRRYHAPQGVPKIPHILNVLRNLPSAVTYAPWFLYHRYISKMRIPGFFVRNPGLTYGLSYHAEHFPAADSRVWLTDEKDAAGLPRLAIDLKFSRKDAEALLDAHLLLDRWLRDNRLGTVNFRQPVEQSAAAILASANHGTHHIGTSRMGRNRDEGVVDGNLRTFDVGNLYVASSSVFPTSGQANPTLTAVALAVRLADHLASAQQP